MSKLQTTDQTPEQLNEYVDLVADIMGWKNYSKRHKKEIAEFWNEEKIKGDMKCQIPKL